MAAINDLIGQIQDPELRAQIEREVSKLAKQKKFGLVFEEHLPECTPLYDVPVRRGRMVARKTGKVNDTYVVLKLDGDTAVCLPKDGSEAQMIPVKELVTVAEFGEPIYPYLKLMDSVCNAPDSDLWHTLIEADNYHALQLLEYLYAGKVDCIYIDPPYNTGARDWKYNNDYVDGADTYRHSKWLSFMQKRLKLAKKLLNPKDSVLIVTIDEKEYLHLGCLLEEMFPDAQIQMVSISINPSGAIRKDLFSRADEYAYYVLLGNSHIVQPKGESEETEVRWWYLRRLEYGSRRGTVKGGIAQFYPIYIDNQTHQIIKIARYVTWPRTVCSIIGRDIHGLPLKGDYGILEEEYILDEDSAAVSKTTGKPLKKNLFIKKKVQKAPILAEIKKSEGFKANAAFFKLGFLDKNAIALGRQFREMLPTLWMKAGACGPCPVLDGDEMPAMLVLPENRFAVLIEESAFTAFEDAIREHPQISTIYIVTDYEAGYRAMARSFEGKQTYQLYRDYLDNFRINTGRN